MEYLKAARRKWMQDVLADTAAAYVVVSIGSAVALSVLAIVSGVVVIAEVGVEL